MVHLGAPMISIITLAGIHLKFLYTPHCHRDLFFAAFIGMQCVPRRFPIEINYHVI